MKCGKTASEDDVAVEMIRFAGDELKKTVCEIVRRHWRDAREAESGNEAEKWPDEWKIALQIPLWKKKGDRSDKNTWRGITLLSVGTKLVARVVASRIQTWLKKYLPETQMGFRGGRGTDDALQVSRRVSEEVLREKGEGRVVIALYDIEKAYPRVCRKALWRLLRHWGMPKIMLAVVKALHDFTEVKVKIYGGVSKAYKPGKGLREGCPSSPPLFNAYHTVVMSDFRRRRKRKAEEKGLTPGLDWTTKVDGKLRRPHQERRVKQKGRIQHQDRQIIGDVEFADDTALFANIEGTGRRERAEGSNVRLGCEMKDWQNGENHSCPRRETRNGNTDGNRKEGSPTHWRVDRRKWRTRKRNDKANSSCTA